MKMIQDIIIKPVISEASMDMMEQENGCKKYVFKVMKKATKPEIAKAVEEMFGVEVKKVNTMNVKSKPKRLGVHAGSTRSWKKAIVTLTEGSKSIAFFDSMN